MSRHLVLCGGLAPVRNESGERLGLMIGDKPGGIDLGIEQLRGKLVSDLPCVLTDLLEIATYIYAADSHVSRGGDRMHKLGSDWRRQFRFAIPVRCPDLWSSRHVLETLADTVGFLSDDSYEFRFEQIENPTPWPANFEFGGKRGEGGFVADEILLFSGGLDSLAGTLAEILDNHHRVAIVSHRSSPKMLGDQRKLLKALEAKIGAGHFWHVPVRLTLATGTADERTHRTRSFLYASLGVVVAALFRRRRIRFFENGVISLHLPISAHVLGARATRSTHPRVLDGLTKLFSQLLGEPFKVENPFFGRRRRTLWHLERHRRFVLFSHRCRRTVR